MFKDILNNIIFRNLSFLVSFINSIIVARYLGPEGRGQIYLINILLILIFYFGQLGLSSGITFVAAKEKYSFNVLFLLIIFFSFVLGSLSSVLFYLLNYLKLISFNLSYLSFWNLLLFYLTIPIVFFYNFLNALYIGKSNFKVFYFLSVFVPVENLFVYIIFIILLNSSINVIILFMLLSYWLVFFFFTIKLNKYIKFSFKNYKLFFDKEIINYSLKSYLTTFLSTYTIKADTVVVNTLYGNKLLGIYSIAVLFRDILYSMADAIAVIIFPKLVKEKRNYEITNICLRFATIIMIFLLVLVNYFSNFLINLFYGIEFIEATKILSLLSPAIFFLSLQSILVRQSISKDFPFSISLYWLISFLIAYVGSYYSGKIFNFYAIPIVISVSFCLLYFLMIREYLLKSNTKLLDVLILKKKDILLLNQKIKEILKK